MGLVLICNYLARFGELGAGNTCLVKIGYAHDMHTIPMHTMIHAYF